MHDLKYRLPAGREFDSITKEIDALGETLDRVHDLDSKGVHAAITKHEAHSAVLRTYILLEQLAQLVDEGNHEK